VTTDKTKPCASLLVTLEAVCRSRSPCPAHAVHSDDGSRHTPENGQGRLPVILFIHGGVWIASNFENHKRLVRAWWWVQARRRYFVEYTPIPDAVYPTQIEENYAAAKWVAAHGADIGIDGTRMAGAGSSVGGDMAAVPDLIPSA
jgi:acetyl esterase